MSLRKSKGWVGPLPEPFRQQKCRVVRKNLFLREASVSGKSCEAAVRRWHSCLLFSSYICLLCFRKRDKALILEKSHLRKQFSRIKFAIAFYTRSGNSSNGFKHGRGRNPKQV